MTMSSEFFLNFVTVMTRFGISFSLLNAGHIHRTSLALSGLNGGGHLCMNLLAFLPRIVDQVSVFLFISDKFRF